MDKIDIIAACTDLGVHVDGSSMAPKVLLQNMKENLENINEIKEFSIKRDYKKEKELNNNKKNLNEINLFNKKVYNAIKESIKNGCLPITIGGDHSVAIASALASINKYKEIGIIWFDSHGDYNTFETTTTGNIHGLPLAAITGYKNELLTKFHQGNFYNPKKAVIFGARDIDKPHEMENIKDAGVTIITTNDIKKYGAEKMAEKAFQIASNGTKGIHISYDIDCIDPKLAPGVSVPAVNGLNLDEAYVFVDYIVKYINKVKSIDLVEFNPLLDINHKTEKIALEVLRKIINNKK